MKDKAIFKKWWFWVVIAVIVLSLIGAFTQSDSEMAGKSNKPAGTSASTNNAGALPQLNTVDYSGEEGLIVYKELKAKGYTVDADFDKPALTEINGKASNVFEPLDPNKLDDRQSVDAFVVGELTQTGDNVELTITSRSKN